MKLAVAIEPTVTGTADPRKLLVALGMAATGIGLAPAALPDLTWGGRNRVPGCGVDCEFDIDSDGQVRRCARIATSMARVTPIPSRRCRSSWGGMCDPPRMEA